MTFIIFSLIAWLGSAFAYYYFISNLWYFIPLWIILGMATSGLLIVIILILIQPIAKYTSVHSKFKYWLLKSISRFINFYLGVRIKARGIENIPKEGRLTIYGNHKSQIDPFLIAAVFPRLLAFTPKISLYKIPVIKNYMNYYNFLPIDRDDNRRTAKTMINAIRVVKDGLAMVIFPEGGIKTRETQKILDIKGGAFKIGMKSESDFLPVSIVNNHKIEKLKFWKFWQRLQIDIYFHPVIKYERVKELNTLELADIMKDTINSKL